MNDTNHISLFANYRSILRIPVLHFKTFHFPYDRDEQPTTMAELCPDGGKKNKTGRILPDRIYKMIVFGLFYQKCQKTGQQWKNTDITSLN